MSVICETALRRSTFRFGRPRKPTCWAVISTTSAFVLNGFQLDRHRDVNTPTALIKLCSTSSWARLQICRTLSPARLQKFSISKKK